MRVRRSHRLRIETFLLVVAALVRGRAGAEEPIAFGPTTMHFGVVYLGGRRVYPVVMRNTGGAEVTITSVGIEGSGLSDTLGLPCRLAGGASIWFTVTYAPGASGPTRGGFAFKDVADHVVGSLSATGEAVALDGTNSVSVVAFGARGDGHTDDTRSFRAAARAAGVSGKVLYVPKPPSGQYYLVTGVVELHGSIVGEPGGEKPEIRMEGANGQGHPGGADPYTLLYYKGNSAGTVIAGLHLDGGRPFAPHTHVYGLPEQSHGIALQDVSHVRIEDNVIENTQGDAILIGGEPGTHPCVDVEVVDNVLRHPMRCAVFAADTRDLKVYLNRISKVVEYQSALDFEPNQDPQSDWDAEVAYNDFDTTLRYDHGIITSTVATKIPRPGGEIRVHDNWGASGRYSFSVNLAAPGSAWKDNLIQDSLLESR
jgi:hypothetical protein